MECSCIEAKIKNLLRDLSWIDLAKISPWYLDLITAVTHVGISWWYTYRPPKYS
jgi:hypothetical protein